MADDPTPTPTAAPITVGELTDVPVPLSPIAAQFHQEVANRVAHRFPNVTAMNAWAAADGSLAFSLPPRFYVRTAGAWRPVPFYDELQALADRPVTSPMIQDGTILPADLDPSVLSGAWTQIGDTGSNWNSEFGFYKRLGNIGHFHFQGVLAASGIAVIYDRLPAGMRPGVQLIFGWPPVTWVIGTDGVVQVIGGFTSGQVGFYYCFNATFPVV
jgi:hypothetical protein